MSITNKLSDALPTVSASGGEAIGGILSSSIAQPTPPRPANRHESFLDGIAKSRGTSAAGEAGTGTEISMAEAPAISELGALLI